MMDCVIFIFKKIELTFMTYTSRKIERLPTKRMLKLRKISKLALNDRG